MNSIWFSPAIYSCLIKTINSEDPMRLLLCKRTSLTEIWTLASEDGHYSAFLSASWQQPNHKNIPQCHIYWSNLIGGALTLNLKAGLNFLVSYWPIVSLVLSTIPVKLGHMFKN